MASVSVVQYSTNTSPHKVTNVLQQSSITNNNNNETRRDILILRKPTSILSKDDILLTNTSKKKIANKKEVGVTKPAPIAVARRNARERNRVKQVNNGFANLRQHIPNSIAAAFESNNGRGGNKKLSKVETLRMAVEYIRRLEDILASSEPQSSQQTENQNFNTYNPAFSPSADEDDLSSTNPTPPPHQRYIKVQVSDAIQLLPVQIYEDSENMDPIDESLLSDPSLLSSDLEFTEAVQNLNLLNSINTNASLSPEMYSDNSLSPSGIDKSIAFHSENAQSYQNVIPVFQSRHVSEEMNHLVGGEVKFRLIPPDQPLGQIKAEPNQDSTVLINQIVSPHRTSPSLQIDHSHLADSRQIQHIKLEKSDVALVVDQKPNVLDVITWWNQQQQSTPS